MLYRVRNGNGCPRYVLQDCPAERSYIGRNCQERAATPFLQQKLDLYFDVTEATSQLATSTDAQIWKSGYAQFLQLHWGKLSVVRSLTNADESELGD